MRMLISVKDAEEAREVVSAGCADILDVKNPAEGTLGANHPWVVEEVKDILPPGMELAAAIGDLDFKPGSASLAAYGAATLGCDYVTASMYRMSEREVGEMTRSLLRALQGTGTKLIIAGYADHARCGAPDPFEFLELASDADYIMLDTAIKDGRNILDFAGERRLSAFIARAHALGLGVIIAGSLRYPQLDVAKTLGADVLGFRGIVCENGAVKRELVERLGRELT